MKKNKKNIEVEVKPKRLTRAERRQAKNAQKAAEQLALCRQAGEFHKAYLEIELGVEQARFDEIQARLAALQTPEVETVETVTEEEYETFANDAIEEIDEFDNE